MKSTPYTAGCFAHFFFNWALCLILGGGSLAAQAEGWSDTGSMSTARHSHAATLLPTGKVLVTGGYQAKDYNELNTTELYDPATGTWTPSGTMHSRHTWHTATLLPNGKVLVAGGEDSCCFPTDVAELYNAATRTWITTGSLHTARTAHTATLLPNGKVLVAGGYHYCCQPITDAELYDPATGTWTTTGSMHTARYFHTDTLLPNGKVLVTGGAGGDASAELYDPATGTWSTAANMHVVRRHYHGASLLPNGKVLVAGGWTDAGVTATAELYDPATGTWAVTGSMKTARGIWRSTTLLASGDVLVVGGVMTNGDELASAELYNPATGQWTYTESMTTPRREFPSVLLPNGKVLVVGGANNFQTNILATATLYTPAEVNEPSTPHALSVSPTAIRLSWKDSADGEKGFRIQSKEGLCSSANEWTIRADVGANTRTFLDTLVAPASPYSYRVATYLGAGGFSAYSPCASATTGAAGTPHIPLDLTVISRSNTRIDLHWWDVSENETAFDIYRREDTGGWVLLDTVMAGTQHYNDLTAAGNSATMSYSYDVRACNEAGCSMPNLPSTVPFRPASLAAAVASNVKLTWKDKSSNETAFHVERKNGSCTSAMPWLVLRVLPANTQVYTDHSAVSGTTYAYRVRAAYATAALPRAFGRSRYTACVTATAP